MNDTVVNFFIVDASSFSDWREVGRSAGTRRITIISSGQESIDVHCFDGVHWSEVRQIVAAAATSFGYSDVIARIVVILLILHNLMMLLN